MAALRALHPDRKARGYSQKDASCATRKMRSELVFCAAVWRGLFFLGNSRFDPLLAIILAASLGLLSATPTPIRSDPACSRFSRSGRP